MCKMLNSKKCWIELLYIKSSHSWGRVQLLYSYGHSNLHSEHAKNCDEAP